MKRTPTSALAALLAAGVATGPGVAAAPAATEASAPAGGTLLITINGNLHLIRPDGTGLRRLTTGGGIGDADFSPDGTKIAFTKGAKPSRDLYLMNADGTGVRRLTNTPTRDEANPSFSPDGRKLAFALHYDGTKGGIAIMTAAPGAHAKVIKANTRTPDEIYYRVDPSWSPRGGRIAYSDLHCYIDDHCFYALRLISPDGASLPPEYLNEGIRVDFNPAGNAIAAVFSDYWDGEFVYTTNLTTGASHDWYPARYYNPIWSPTGSELAVQCSDQVPFSLCRIDADGSGSVTMIKRGAENTKIVPRAWRAF